MSTRLWEVYGFIHKHNFGFVELVWGGLLSYTFLLYSQTLFVHNMSYSEHDHLIHASSQGQKYKEFMFHY